jgi:hypothetical protein
MNDLMAACLAIASPASIGGTAPSTIKGTNITATGQFSGSGAGLTGSAPNFTAGSANSVTWANIAQAPTKLSQFTNDPGYLTGISAALVAAALGYTPYNSENPSGFITAAAIPAVGTATPLVNGTAAIGNSGKYADSLHVHPVDTSRQAALGFTPPSQTGSGASGTWPISISGTANYASSAGSAPSFTNLTKPGRSLGAGYTNSTTHPMLVCVTATSTGGSAELTAYVNGNVAGFSGNGGLAQVVFIVPSGLPYNVNVTQGSATLNQWTETY